MEGNISPVVIVAMMVFPFLLYQLWYLKKEEKAFIQDDKTFKALFTWRQNNQDFYIGDSLHARQLVLERIEALEYLYTVCRWLKRDEGYIQFYYSLLNEHGPEPPRKRKHTKNSTRDCAVFLFVYMVSVG